MYLDAATSPFPFKPILRRTWKFGLILSLIVIAFGFKIATVHAQNVSINSARNCDDNAVVFCGAGSVDQLVNKYNNGDGHNSATSIHNIYSYFGISSSAINAMAGSSNVMVGEVTSSGVVTVNGQTVATNALTGGRQNISGSSTVDENGTVFYVRPPSVSFVSSPLRAFVVMNNGRFDFAILASCGNAVRATPTTPPPKPAPPKPVPPKPSPPRTVVTTARPTNVCSGNTNNSNSGTASQGGNCSVNTTVVQTQTVQNSQTQAQQTTPQAQQQIATSSTPAPAETSATVSTTPTSLVNTGPGQVVGLFILTTITGIVGSQLYLRRHSTQS